MQVLGDIHFFKTNVDTFNMICTTPDVRVVVARTWTLIVARWQGDPIPDPQLRILCEFLGTCKGLSVYPESLAEFAEGAGGSMLDLACLVVQHLRLFHSQGQTASDAGILIGIRLFFAHLHWVRRWALLSRADLLWFPEVFVKALCSLQSSPDPTERKPLERKTPRRRLTGLSWNLPDSAGPERHGWHAGRWPSAYYRPGNYP
ncbi:hypothetical protein C8J57DRAFT_234850 [Mycena rebaudengoi]|nr:hypothetical protein C8J57DRAFT_234850 [Mycena rebaudengoi]